MRMCREHRRLVSAGAEWTPAYTGMTEGMPTLSRGHGTRELGRYLGARYARPQPPDCDRVFD